MSGKLLRLLPIMLFGFAGPAQAAEGGLLDPNTGLTAWTIITFLIVLAVLWKLALPPILGAVEAREQQIRDLIAAAAHDRDEAQTALAEQTRQLEETRSRVQEMVAEGRAAGERSRDEIITEARRQAEDIVSRSRREVQAQLDRALQELRVEAVDLALAAASKLVERNLDDDDNRRLVREYLAEVETGGGTRLTAGV